MSFIGIFTTAMAALTLSAQKPLPDQSPGQNPAQEAELSIEATVGEAALLQADEVMTPHKTLEGLETFMDGVVGGLQQTHKVPGVTVSVVYDGAVQLSKGYGYADVARTRPVSADTTLFRPGSISKTFTWTAVMQLVEQGKLDLDTDVNEYLTQFQIPEAYGEPITMRHILTHTAGFEDGGLGFLFAKDASDLTSVASFLEKHMPARVRAPGVLSAYSNWASALAGVIVANQSGMDFDTYMDKNIFEPLDMNHTTFREPLPDELAEKMSASLSRKGGQDFDAGFEYIHNFAGAGSMSTTARDMARYMLAHLGDGEYDGARILKPETARQMRDPLFRQHEAVNAMLYGFMEQTHNGRFSYGHGGATIHFHSRMAMLPEEGVGIFISTNSSDGRSLARPVVKAFFDEYFPPKADYPHPALQEGSRQSFDHLKEYVGTFRTTRRTYENYEKVVSLMGNDAEFIQAKNGGLIANGQRFIEESKDVFVSVDDPDSKVVFDRNDKGVVTTMFWKLSASASSERIGFFDKTNTHHGILGLGLVLSIGLVVGSIWAFPKWLASPSGEKLSRMVLFGACLSYVVFAGMLGLSVSGNQNTIVVDGVPNLPLILTISVVTSLLTVAAFVLAIPAWSKGYWSLFGRLRHTVVILVMLGVVWSLYYWNLIGPWNA